MGEEIKDFPEQNTFNTDDMSVTFDEGDEQSWHSHQD